MRTETKLIEKNKFRLLTKIYTQNSELITILLNDDKQNKCEMVYTYNAKYVNIIIQNTLNGVEKSKFIGESSEDIRTLSWANFGILVNANNIKVYVNKPKYKEIQLIFIVSGLKRVIVDRQHHITDVQNMIQYNNDLGVQYYNV